MRASAADKGAAFAKLIAFAFIVLGFAMVGVGILSAMGADKALASASTMNGATRQVALAAQGFAHMVIFLVASLLFIAWIDRKDVVREYFSRPKFNMILAFGFAAGLFFVYTPFVGMLEYWNAGLNLPNSWEGLEQSLRSMEEKNSGLVKALLAFDSFPQFLFGLFVIAVLPGVGEELMFRGVIQPKIHVITGNGHLAVWITAIIFSAIHLQFYGFLPRMFIGIILGYYYLWSGNLMVPIFAHFFNNTFTVTMYYLYSEGVSSLDVEKKDAFPVWASLLSLVLTLGVLYFLHDWFTKHRPESKVDDLKANG